MKAYGILPAYKNHLSDVATPVAALNSTVTPSLRVTAAVVTVVAVDQVPPFARQDILFDAPDSVILTSNSL